MNGSAVVSDMTPGGSGGIFALDGVWWRNDAQS